MKCENCNYYSMSEGVDYEHCCFTEWGHADWELAPCDDPDFDDEPYESDYDDYGSNFHCDTYGVCGGTDCPRFYICHS